jgi:hypothetical protein
MLCSFAADFPHFVARFLERDRSLTRNFREETITDLLMASLVAFRRLGITVQFPNETLTGGDMEFIFVSPHEISGGRYCRILIQAKRAHLAARVRNPYWFYQHLDHLKGNQAKILTAQAKDTLPL